jgi:hypothetical protein
MVDPACGWVVGGVVATVVEVPVVTVKTVGR